MKFLATLFAAIFAVVTLVAASPVKRGHSGQATWYYQHGNPGACGNYNPDSAKVVALDSRLYSGSKCGKFVKITNTSNGKSVTAKVADMCPTCASSGSLDLSVATFRAIGDLDTGFLPISWDFVDSDQKYDKAYNGKSTSESTNQSSNKSANKSTTQKPGNNQSNSNKPTHKSTGHKSVGHKSTNKSNHKATDNKPTHKSTGEKSSHKSSDNKSNQKSDGKNSTQKSTEKNSGHKGSDGC